ncbi:MAG: hypothetical protein AWU57_537 [Marinobacter sp. T13-3]|nr:MAG: hypothetical protein AWU57_537 [Marinobacter sp. T13-3]
MPGLRSPFVWHCAKSGRPINGEITHLYLPMGHRIEGFSDGSNVFFVTYVYSKQQVRMPNRALDRLKWMRGVIVQETAVDVLGTTQGISLSEMDRLMRSFAVDLRHLVGNQLVGPERYRQSLADDATFRTELTRSTKLVVDREYSELDTFESLHPSFQSLQTVRARRAMV